MLTDPWMVQGRVGLAFTCPAMPSRRQTLIPGGEGLSNVKKDPTLEYSAWLKCLPTIETRPRPDQALLRDLMEGWVALVEGAV